MQDDGNRCLSYFSKIKFNSKATEARLWVLVIGRRANRRKFKIIKCILNVIFGGKSNARATLDKQSCVITSTLFEINSTCMRWCDLNFSCLSTSITSADVSSCQNKRRYPNPIWSTVFTFRVFKLSYCEFTTMVSIHLHKST